MNFAVKFGNSYGTSLNLHISWLWILPLMAFTLVWHGVSEWLGAITTVILIFGSVLSAALAQLWAAHWVGLQWQQMTLFILGGVVKRSKRSNPQQEVRVAGMSVITYLLLCLMFGVSWAVSPAESTRMMLRTVTLFNACMLLFSLFLRLSPYHDNVLHATLTTLFDHPWPRDIMILFHSIALPSFMIAGGVFMLAIGWVSFSCWAVMVVMLSQLTTTAEMFGEYQEDLDTWPAAVYLDLTQHDRPLPNARPTQKNEVRRQHNKDL